MAILSTTPSSLATNVARNVAFKATFDVDLDRNTVTSLNVLLVKSSDGSSIQGVADYIPGTKSVTFQLTQLLEKSTQYTWILVGRNQGIKTASSVAALPANFQVNFTTGIGIDYSLPLAPSTTTLAGITPFSGGRGVYDVVFGQTGEPISHVVTTAGQVGPSGNIIPAPFSTEVYLSISGGLTDPEKIAISGVSPAAGATFISDDVLTTIAVSFNEVPDVTNGSVDVLVEDLLDIEIDQPTFTKVVSNNAIVVTPDFWRAGSKYTVTVSKDISAGVAGTELGEDYVYSFTVKPDKYYTTVKMVRINLGDAAATVPDETIQLLIYENSIWAFDNAYTSVDEDDPPRYIKDYVLCKTKMDVMNIVLMGTDAPTSEKIGEVEFKYGSKLTDRFKQKIEELMLCINHNKDLILNGGITGGVHIAVRGQYFPGRPIMNNTWRRLNTNGSFPRQRRSQDDY